jgi:hypothetical protein
LLFTDHFIKAFTHNFEELAALQKAATILHDFKAFLSDKVGMAKVERNRLVKSLFGNNL